MEDKSMYLYADYTIIYGFCCVLEERTNYLHVDWGCRITNLFEERQCWANIHIQLQTH